MEKTPHKEKPFPWRCPKCGSREVSPSAQPYKFSANYDGRIYQFEVDSLDIPTCRSCGERVFSKTVNDEIDKAIRRQLRLLTPEQIRHAVAQLRLSQKDIAAKLGVAEATFSRWVTGTVIQSRAMDNLLRVYFAVPAVRDLLLGDAQDEQLGVPVVSQPSP